MEKTFYELYTVGSGGGVVTDLRQNFSEVRNATHRGRGHKGWFKARFEINDHWKLDLFASHLHYFTLSGRTSFLYTLSSVFPGIFFEADLGNLDYKGVWKSTTIALDVTYEF